MPKKLLSISSMAIDLRIDGGEDCDGEWLQYLSAEMRSGDLRNAKLGDIFIVSGRGKDGKKTLLTLAKMDISRL